MSFPSIVRHEWWCFIQLKNFMVLQQKSLTSPSYRHADDVWSLQSIILVHQQLGAEDPLSGRFFFDWEASGAAFAQFMMDISRGSPVKVLKLTKVKDFDLREKRRRFMNALELFFVKYSLQWACDLVFKLLQFKVGSENICGCRDMFGALTSGPSWVLSHHQAVLSTLQL